MTDKKHYLRWWDIAIVTLILFGSAIWNSTQIFLTSDPNALAQGAQFSTDDNIYAIVVQSFELAIAFLYLKVRRFDFSQWKYQVTWKGTLFAAALFLGLALLMDIISIIAYGWPAVSASIGTGGLTMLLGEIDLSLIVFSLLNGFYEEIFFLGICTAVAQPYQPLSLVYALLVRVSFHTYQGLPTALGIGLGVGLVYYIFFRTKGENLYPYMLSHSIADVIGLGILPLL